MHPDLEVHLVCSIRQLDGGPGVDGRIGDQLARDEEHLLIEAGNTVLGQPAAKRRAS